MSNNWDLFILDPILLVLGIGILTFIVVRERTSWKWISLFSSTSFFWFVSSIILSINLKQLNATMFDNSLLIVLLFLGSAALFSIFLRPLATWLTGRTHMRTWWIFLAFIGLILSLILSITNQAVNSVLIFVLVAFFLGFALSSNSLYYLILNEQFYYRIAPVLSTVLVSSIISFTTFAGNYFVNLESSIVHFDFGQYYIGSSILAIAFLVGFGLLLLFVPNREDQKQVNTFEFNQLKQLPKYNYKKLLYLMISVFLLASFFALTQSSLINDYLHVSFIIKGYSWQSSAPWVRSFSKFFIVPQFLLGYLMYKKLILKLGFKSVLIGLLAATLIVILFMAFLDNPYVYVILNFFLGLTFSQVFYAFFSMAIMWNYRVKNVPVTGLVSMMAVLGTFIVETIIGILKVEQQGIFSGYKNGQIGELNINQATQFQEMASGVVIISFAIVGVFAIFAIVVLFFTFKFAFGEYYNINIALQNSKTLIRDQQRTKSNTRILVSEIKMGAEN